MSSKVLYDVHIRVVQPDDAVDSINIKLTREWEGMSTAQELGLLLDVHGQDGAYLGKAVNMAAARGIAPDLVADRAPTPVPSPSPAPGAESTSRGMAEPWVITP